MRNDNTYKKLQESWKKMEEGSSEANTTRMMSAMAPSDDSIAITKFIEKFGREPKTNNDDWMEVMRLLPTHPLFTAERDYRLKVWRTKKAIVDYWKNKRLSGKV